MPLGGIFGSVFVAVKDGGEADGDNSEDIEDEDVTHSLTKIKTLALNTDTNELSAVDQNDATHNLGDMHDA